MTMVYINSDNFCESTRNKYFKNQDLVSISDLVDLIEDLNSDLESLKEKFDDFKQEVNDNYKFVGQAEQIGYNENW